MNRQQRRVEQKPPARKNPPRDFRAYFSLGNLLAHRNRLDEAASCFRAALALKPDSPEAHYNLGNALRDLHRLDEAAACFRAAATEKADFAEAHNNLGAVLEAMGRPAEAVAAFRVVLALLPEDSRSHYNLGNALRAAGHPGEAIAAFRAAIALKPDFSQAHNNLGNTLRDQGCVEDAVVSLRAALALAPDDPVAHSNLANALRDLGCLDEAVSCCRAALALKADYPEAHLNLGAALKDQGLLGEAIACFRVALALAPDLPPAHNNLGTALRDLGCFEKATKCFRAALALKADFAEAHNNLGTVLRDQGFLDDAIACYHRALQFRADDADTHFNLGMALLARGDFAAGFQEYEWRTRTPRLRKGYGAFSTRPRWRGEAAAGKSLLIHAEQGFGDTIQFCRYATLAVARGLRVILEVQKPLVRLLQDSLPGVDRVIAQGDFPGDTKIDFQCPMLSLPLAFATTLETIPVPEEPYLRADPAEIAGWKDRLAGGPQKRVGLVWAGNASPAMAVIDRRRSIAPEFFAPLFDLPEIIFVSLQKDGKPAPKEFPVIDVMGEMNDFADTAALVMTLDLVISVDTAVAHLAAALGKPVWLLNRFDACWRWLAGRRESPWYPTLRLYHQPRPGDWESVLAEVTHDLKNLAA